jgi:uncharacterized protein YjiS (DUF1127 family)
MEASMFTALRPALLTFCSQLGNWLRGRTGRGLASDLRDLDQRVLRDIGVSPELMAQIRAGQEVDRTQPVDPSFW